MLSWIRISKRDGSNIYPKSMKSSNPVFLSKGCQMLLVSNKKIGAVLFRIHMVVQFNQLCSFSEDSWFFSGFVAFSIQKINNELFNRWSCSVFAEFDSK